MQQVIARVNNLDVVDLPKDLYIDPEALQIFLEMFEGPLDLLLYLIRKQNLDILSIPIANITDQYITYINAMQTINIDLAAEYLLMAATLLAIKSRMMLPPASKTEKDEEQSNLDPRNELIQKLLEYEKIKLASISLSEMPLLHRDYQWVNIELNTTFTILPKVCIEDLKNAWQRVLLQAITRNTEHNIERQELSVREYMTIILRKLSTHKTASFFSMFEEICSISHVVVNFVAILELTKEGLIQLEMSKSDIILVLT